jgi:hypothetical protein
MKKTLLVLVALVILGGLGYYVFYTSNAGTKGIQINTISNNTYATHEVVTDWKTYSSPTSPGGITFQYPANWSVDDPWNDDYLVLVTAPDGSSFKVNGNGMYNPCPPNGTSVMIDGHQGHLFDWNSNNVLKLCVQDLEGTNITGNLVASSKSPEDRQMLSKIVSTFHFLP